MKKPNIKKIIAIVVGLILSIAILFVGFGVISKVMTRASSDAPTDVSITDISQNSAKINWSTQNDTQGVIEYGTSLTALNFFAPETKSGKTHSVELTLLAKDTSYFFQVRIGNKKYGIGGANSAGAENGQPWDFKTKASSAPETSTLISPSPVPTQALSISPTPVSSIVIPNGSTGTTAACTDTDCVKICQNKQPGGACTTQDFQKNSCIGKVQWDTCAEVPTPTPTP